jgi:hypothetical protein
MGNRDQLVAILDEIANTFAELANKVERLKEFIEAGDSEPVVGPAEPAQPAEPAAE